MPAKNLAKSEFGEPSARQLWPIWAGVGIIIAGVGLRVFLSSRPEALLAKQRDQHVRSLIDGYLARVQASRRNQFTPAQRKRIYEFTQSQPLKSMLRGISEKPPDEQQKLIEGTVRMALVRSGETLPVPTEITASVLAETPDEDLPQMLYDFVCTRFKSTGAYNGGDESFRRVLLSLPRGLRVVFTTTALDGEISNGGVGQLFTNSSGTYLAEILEDCRLIGAERHAAVLKEAMVKWRPRERFDAAESELDEWDHRYDALEKTEPLQALVTKYLRSHPGDCLTSPGVTK